MAAPPPVAKQAGPEDEGQCVKGAGCAKPVCEFLVGTCFAPASLAIAASVTRVFVRGHCVVCRCGPLAGLLAGRLAGPFEPV